MESIKKIKDTGKKDIADPLEVKDTAEKDIARGVDGKKRFQVS